MDKKKIVVPTIIPLRYIAVVCRVPVVHYRAAYITIIMSDTRTIDLCRSGDDRTARYEKEEDVPIHTHNIIIIIPGPDVRFFGHDR